MATPDKASKWAIAIAVASFLTISTIATINHNKKREEYKKNCAEYVKKVQQQKQAKTAKFTR